MAPLLSYQPFKTLHALLAIAFGTLRFPFWILLYSRPGGRPRAQWTAGQALKIRILKAFLATSSAMRARTGQSLEPGKEKERFVVMQPAPEGLYKGPVADKEIKPEEIGGTWTPKPFDSSEEEMGQVDVVLHFHGGAYVIGSGRDSDTGFLAKTLLKHGRATHVFTPQYRLSSNPGGRFPAALQDAVTSYNHLVNTLKIPASRIIISGDSAGGNLALTLLRYLSVYGDELGLAWPGCVWLWSPWVDVHAAIDPQNTLQSPQYPTDFIVPGFGGWGVQMLCPPSCPIDASSPWLSPLNHPFASKSPIFIQTGDAEILYDNDVQMSKQLQSVDGNVVKLEVTRHAPHDIILTGIALGFVKEASEIAKAAGDFLRSERAVL